MKDIDKMNRTALETTLKNASELFEKNDKTLLALGAGIVANGAERLFSEGIDALVTTTLKSATKADTEADFKKEMRKRLEKCKELEMLHDALQFLALFTSDVALEAASKTVKAMEGDKNPFENFSRN